MTFFQDQARAWSSPPVDDVGYIPSSTMLGWPDAQLVDTINRMRFVRYSEEAWRNWGGGWRSGLQLDVMQGLTILDYGCGVGMEALDMAINGNYVVLADISPDNIALASRVMNLWGVTNYTTMPIDEEFPFFPDVKVDVIHCSGVLHHIPYAPEVIRRFAEILKPRDGEVHLMLYSDRGWRTYIGTEPPEDVTTDPRFGDFVLTFDQVGSYADWYDEAKIVRLTEHEFDLVDFRYITIDDRYCTAVLLKR